MVHTHVLYFSFKCKILVDEEFQSRLGRFNRQAGYQLGDIYDGKSYKDGGFLSNPMNVSLQMNTDGAQVFKSSTLSLWPVYFVINELQPHLRYHQ